ncbi:hypothetical protein ACIPVK_18740 [Paeniglutamicibacter sp. MACA_103]|uniref:hypothetical protein n=1 Tax=Paeniglutamicibacter sp. MACA_103 TaxID=3377337 RepID=UPI003895DA2D
MPTTEQPIDLALLAFVEEFRTAAKDTQAQHHKSFPNAACNWASEILGRLLSDKGFGTWQLIKASGRLDPEGSPHTHDWLEKDGVHVDPTAGQFNDRKIFAGKELPIAHRGESPICHVFGVYDSRDVLVEGVHHSAEGAHRIIRSRLGM